MLTLKATVLTVKEDIPKRCSFSLYFIYLFHFFFFFFFFFGGGGGGGGGVGGRDGKKALDDFM